MTNAPDHRIRPARDGDIPSVIRLSQIWAKEGCTPGYSGFAEGDGRLKSWLEGGYFFVCEIDDAVIAYTGGIVKLGKNAVFKPEGERFLHVHRAVCSH